MSAGKRHTPKSTRDAIVANLQEQIAENGGTPPPGSIRLTARHLKVSRWTVYRWLGLDPNERSNRAQRGLTTDELTAIALNGSVAGAHEDLVEQGKFTGSLSKLYRIAEATEPALLQGALHGMEGVRSNTVSVVRQRPRPLELVSLDHLKNPIQITGEGGNKEDTWLTIIIDHGSNWQIPVPTFCRAENGGANAVTETIVAGLTRFLSGVVASDGTVIGGIFGTLLLDNGLENSALAILCALATIGITFEQTPFFTPNLNGRSERVGGTYKRRFAYKQAGYEDKDAPKLRFGGKMANRGRPPTKIEYLDRLGEFFRKENEKVRDCLGGRSALQTWKDEAPEATLVPRERCRHLFLAEAEEFPMVTNKGVRYDNNYFVNEKLNQLFGEQVALRVLPNSRDLVNVYNRRNGEFVCEAINQKLLDSDRARAVGRARAELHKDIDYVQKAAAASLWLPDQDEDSPAPSGKPSSTTPGIPTNRPPKVAQRKAATHEFLANHPDQEQESA